MYIRFARPTLKCVLQPRVAACRDLGRVTGAARRCALLVVAFVVTGFIMVGEVAAQNDSGPDESTNADHARVADQILADQPVAYWRFSDPAEAAFANIAKDSDGETLRGVSVGQVHAAQSGPRPTAYPLFGEDNAAVVLGGGSYIRVPDPGAASVLDFAIDDTITIEAWIRPLTLADGQNRYIVGKGRTGNNGFETDNQNYALRLRGVGGTARLSFLFRSAGTDETPAEFHRWNANVGFPVNTDWHHVAVTYTFGEPKSLRGYLDGKLVSGTWDMGGATKRGPIVDDDELWIGSALRGNAGNSFVGSVDEVAIYRRALNAEQIAKRFARVGSTPAPPRADPPAGKVLVEVVENIPDQWSWSAVWPAATETYEERSLAMVEIPQKYSALGLRADRSNPMLLRASADVTLPPGEQQILLRGKWGSRLLVDEKPLLDIGFPRGGSSGHHKLYSAAASGSPRMAELAPGDRQKIVTFQSDGKPRRFVLEVIVGGKNRRPELGNLVVATAPAGADFQAISPAGESIHLTDRGWRAFADRFRAEMIGRNTQRRRTADQQEGYWKQRHELAWRSVAAQEPLAIPSVENTNAINNNVDRFVQAKLEATDLEPTGVVDDWGFLRRVSLDTRGIPPTPEEIETFRADKSSDRRARFIDRMLADDGWADHWVGYWQDVLAENPNIVNPTLNNTGPFRWWIHESFLDNKPLDRFASELVLMQGSRYFGGPAGFEMASENDVPMAAKAHIVGEAFLGVEMKCARCHDAPNHDVLQRDLFSLAAMLKRGPEGVPKTSSIQRSPEELELLAVQVTLKPGSKVAPAWPFEKLVGGRIDRELLRNPADSREQLAMLVTSPENKRFAPVLVNRLWARLLGRGMVEPVGDWEQPRPTHPLLLEYLSRELVSHGYDMKHVTRLILNSQVYQRSHAEESTPFAKQKLYPAALRRRLQAEQVVDSMFAVAGKPFDTEEQSVDTDTARNFKQSLSLGHPRRAWMFTSTSNERDRPSLALPASQTIISVLENFGWRGARQSPLTLREVEPSVLQAAILANGTAGLRVTQLSEGSALTELALEAERVEQLVNDTFLRMLARLPDATEKQAYVALLTPGFKNRVRDLPIADCLPPLRPTNVVTWTNHLDPAANSFKKELEEIVSRGDQPTPRLEAGWRGRMSDMVWTLLNSPEFVMMP